MKQLITTIQVIQVSKRAKTSLICHGKNKITLVQYKTHFVVGIQEQGAAFEFDLTKLLVSL